MMRLMLATMMLSSGTALLGQVRSAQELPTAAPAWTATVQGGGLLADRTGDQTYFSAGVSRDLNDRFTIGLTGSYTNNHDDEGRLLALPSKTYQARLSFDSTFGAVSAGAYASYGRRTFSTASYARRNGAVVNVTGSGPAFGIGGNISYDLRVADELYFSPQGTVAYDRADIARILAAPGGNRAIKDSQSGVTGTFGIALLRLFGPSGIGASAAFATSSNAAVYRSGSGQAPIAAAVGGKQADSWGELGATGTLALTARIALTGSALRTVGFANDDGTTVTVGVRLAF